MTITAELLAKAIEAQESQSSTIVKNVYYYFTPISTTPAQGDCFLIQGYDKNILIDCGNTADADAIIDYIDSKDITKIDYLFISHYHTDHWGNLARLITEFDFTDCHVYIPQRAVNRSDSDYYTTVVNILTLNNISYTVVNTELTIEISESDFTIDLFNCTNADYTYYDSVTTDYNEYSMCCMVNHLNTKAFYAGDVKTYAQARLLSNSNLQKCNLYKIQHHGYDANVNKTFYYKIQPEMSVSTLSRDNYITLNSGDAGIASGALNMLDMLDSKVYFPAYEGACEFVSNGINIEVANDINSIGRATYTYTLADFYVNGSATSVGNGTSTTPFKTIAEAVSRIVDNPNVRYRVMISEATYAETIKLNGIKESVVELYGNSATVANIKVTGIDILNCGRILFTNINFTGTADRTLTIDGCSYVKFTNCMGDGVGSKTSVNASRFLVAYGSNVYTKDCTFSNKSCIIVANLVSHVVCEDLGGTGNLYSYYANGGIISELGTSTIVSENNYIEAGGVVLKGFLNTPGTIISLYVDSAAVSSGYGTTALSPFKTIAEAISRIVDNPNIKYIIYIADGSYAETISIFGMRQSFIEIIGNPSTPTNVNITGVDIERCGRINFSGINFTSTSDRALIVDGCSYVKFTTCTGSGTGSMTNMYSSRFLTAYGSIVYVDGCTFSNKSCAINALAGAYVTCNNMAGSGNLFGYQAAGGNISIVGTPTLTATTSLYYEDGGNVFVGKPGGTTANRPSAPKLYHLYFDTTIGKPVWHNGTNWVDATGAIS